MEATQDNILRAYALLSSLRKNIDQSSISEFNSIKSSYVGDYHSALGLLEENGVDVTHFRIPDSELQPQFLSSSSRGTRYSEEKYIRKSYFLSKLDAVLLYFELQTAEPRKQIGFQKT